MEVRKLSTLFSETQLVSARAFIWTEAACLWRLLWSHFLFSWPYFVGRSWLSREKRTSWGEHLSLRPVSPFPISMWPCSASLSPRQTSFWSERFKNTSLSASPKTVQDLCCVMNTKSDKDFYPYAKNEYTAQTTSFLIKDTQDSSPESCVFLGSWENWNKKTLKRKLSEDRDFCFVLYCNASD